MQSITVTIFKSHVFDNKAQKINLLQTFSIGKTNQCFLRKIGTNSFGLIFQTTSNN